MAYESFTTFTQDTGVANSWTDLGTITATPREIINVVIGADNESGSITDSLEVRVLVARDDTPTNYTNAPIYKRIYTPTAITQEWFGFELTGWQHYKIQTQSSGTTDTYTVDGSYKGDGVSA